MIDAATRRPIPGAWVTWRPPPPELVARLLPQAEAGDPGITDAEGRFVLERLPSDLSLAESLYAVAPGYGFARGGAGLSADLVLALPAACGLEVLLDPAPPPGSAKPPVRIRLEPAGEAPALARLVAGLAPWGRDRTSYRLGHLPPGRYRVRVDPQVAGERVYPVELRAGVTAQVRVARAPRVELGGSFIRLPESAEGSGLAAIDVETLTRYEVEVGPEGTFKAELPQARYALVLLDGRSERLIPGRFEPAGDLQLEPPPEGAGVQLELREGRGPLVSSELGLVRLDLPFGDLVALEPKGEAGIHVAQAPPGRYALFLGPSLVAELSLPRRAGAEPLRVARSEVLFEFPLPPGLRPEEEIRGTLSLVPELLESKRPDLAPRLVGSGIPFVVSSERPLIRLPLGATGRYRVAGLSDIGRCSGTFELRPGARVKLELEPR